MPPLSNSAALRALDARLDQVIRSDQAAAERSTTTTTTPTIATPADRLDARRMLDQVRQRLDETRQRIASTAQAMRREAARSNGDEETVDALQSNLNRDIRFASRSVKSGLRCGPPAHPLTWPSHSLQS